MLKLVPEKLTAGEKFYADTHAKLLNNVFRTHYKGFMKCSISYSENLVVFFGRIDGEINGNFANVWIDKYNSYMQKHHGTTYTFGGKPLDLNKESDYRLVFERIDGNPKKYIFRGVYRLNRAQSSDTELRFEKICDVFPCNRFDI